MDATLPVGMMTLAVALVKALWEVARAEPNASLATLEEAVLRVVRQYLPLLLAEVIQANVTALAPARAPARVACVQCGGVTRRQSWRERVLQTTCGVLRFSRPWHVCADPACGHGFSPVDTTLALGAGSKVSAALQRWLARLGSGQSFAEGAATLAELTGIQVVAETVRQHTGAVGRRLEAQQQAAIEQVVQRREAVAPLDPAPGQLVVEVDGGMLRYRGEDGQTGSEWHETKLAVVGGVVDGQVSAPSYVAAREPVAAFGERVLAEAARRGALEVVGWQGGRLGQALAILRQLLVLGDGAAWVWGLAAEYLGALIEILDYWHACEHLSVVAAAVFGPGTPAAAAWASEARHRLRDEGGTALQPVLAALQAPTPEAAVVLRRERAYFRTHLDRTAYPTFRAQGLPIASGAVEGGLHHVVLTRLKRPGCRWSPAGAHAVLTVRCHLASHRPLAA